MIKKIVQSGDVKLRTKSLVVKKVDKKLRDLIQDLKDTLEAQRNPEGVGLAAPQIGINSRVFIVKYENLEGIFINPKIVNSKLVKKMAKNKKDKQKEILEGCLSLPHYYGPLQRDNFVELEYFKIDNDKLVKEISTFKDFDAQIILHEMDHLDGILFIDRLLSQNGKLYKLINDQEWEEVELI